MCNACYEYRRLRGDLEIVRHVGDLNARLEQKIDRNGPLHAELGQCWIWTGAKANGYGRIYVDGKLRPSHRVMYERHHDITVDPALHMDHLCRVPACVNPAHLEPVTIRENLLRGETTTAAHAAKTHCIHGHPFSGDNLYVWRGERHCMECRKAADERRRQKARLG